MTKNVKKIEEGDVEMGLQGPMLAQSVLNFGSFFRGTAYAGKLSKLR